MRINDIEKQAFFQLNVEAVSKQRLVLKQPQLYYMLHIRCVFVTYLIFKQTIICVKNIGIS